MRRVLVLALCVLPFLARAEGEESLLSPPKEKPKVSCEATAGFEGHYRPGGWVPVRVALKNPTEEDLALAVSVELPYGEGGASARFSRMLDLPSGARKALTLYVRPIQEMEGVTVSCRTAGASLPVCSAELEGLRSVPAPRGMVLSVGPGGPVELRRAGYAVAEADVADLPERPEGYDVVDAVVLRDGGWAADPLRAQALAAWLCAGGQAVVAGPEALRALARSDLGRSLGVALGEPGRAARAPGLDGIPLELPAAGVLCEAVTCRAGRTLLQAGEAPAVVETAVGAGRLLLASLDPEVFRGQAGYAPLWGWLLRIPALSSEAEQEAWIAGPGRSWAAEVLDSPLYIRRPIEIPWLWAFLGTYLVAVALVDYFLLKALRSWRLVGLATLLGWALAASVVCYRLGDSGRFTDTLVQRLGAVDAVLDGPLAGRCLTAFYPNGNGVYDLGPAAGPGSAAVVVDPQAVQRSGMLPSETLGWVQDGPALSAREVPIYFGIQKIIESRWHGTWKDLGLVLTPREGRWILENRSPLTLHPAGGGLPIPPGEARDLGPAAAMKEAPGDLLRPWMGPKETAGRPPWRFRARAPGAGFVFRVTGLPLGIGAEADAPVAEDVLLRVHLPGADLL